MRYFVELKYDGTHYHGWQIQPNAITVQEAINKVFSTFLRFPDLSTMGCGRTDTGVHASQFFLHFDFNKEIDEVEFVYRTNLMLPDDIAIIRIFPVSDEMHTRFSAISRSYQYFVSKSKDPFIKNFKYYSNKNFDIEKMNMACEILKSKKDFTSFSKVKTSTKTNICELSHASWSEYDDQLVFDITANRFLRNMVRSIVGTMFMVGEEKISLDQFNEIIELKDRKKAGTSAPACGLFLSKIDYKFD